MNPFDMGGMGGMLQGLQQRALEMRQKAAETKVEGTAGGLVSVTMTCDHKVVDVTIAEEALADHDQLEDLLQVAMQDALGKVSEEMAANMRALTGGLPIPPGLIPGM